jgi:hypothetical protein
LALIAVMMAGMLTVQANDAAGTAPGLLDGLLIQPPGGLALGLRSLAASPSVAAY